MAYDRLDINTASVGLPQEEGKESKLIGDAEYKIRRVKRVQLNDASEICDKLIEKSDNKITNACGVYVEGNFICAVKNETDALSVFDSILAEHETGEENAVVSFVENIDYVQGLYLDSEDTIKDAIERHKEYDIYGVQFHPESVMTPEGAVMMRNFLELV